MRTIFKIFAFCLIAHTAQSQSCDTTGILLELQATTNLQGILFGDDRCLTTATILAPLYVSGDTLRLDTTGLGGGGGGIGLDTLIAIPPAAGFTITGSPAQESRDTLTFTLANDLAALEALADTGIVVRTASETYALRTITAGTGISIANGSGVSGNPTITNTDPDQSTTNEIQTYAHTGTTNYTNTLSLGGGAFTLNAAGILAISHTTGTVTMTATEVDGSVINEAWTIDADDADTEVISNQMVKFQGSGGITTNWVPGTDILEINNTAGTFYQLFRDDGLDKTARPVANYVSSATVAFTLTDDAGNTETEVSAIVPNDAITATQIASGAVGTSEIATGGVATVDIADNAVTYAKIQDVATNNVLLGNDSGANSDVQELTPAEVQTMLGYVDATPAGANQRIPYFTDANTITGEAAFLYDAANDRQTITCALPGLGAGAAVLNLTNTGPDGTGEFLQIRGDISDNLLWGALNTNTSATADNILYISQTGTTSGDPILQFNLSGAGGHSSAMGLDNSDANKLKITPNGTFPGANANASLVATMDAVPLWGINKDAPVYPLDVNGVVRSTEYIGYSADEPTVGTLGNGLGTGATIDDVIGTNNGFAITFTTGTTPTAGGNMFVVTYKKEYSGFSIPVFSQGNDQSAEELTKFSFAAVSGASFTMKVRAGQTLTASKQYILNYAVNGF